MTNEVQCPAGFEKGFTYQEEVADSLYQLQ